MNLYLKSFAQINLAEQPFQRDSWTQHILIRLRPNFSTASLDQPCIVSTFHKYSRNLHILHTWCGCWMAVWIGPPTSNFFSVGNKTISIGYGPVIHNIIWHFAWFDWGRKFYCWMPFLMQTCWQTRKLDVFTWDNISQLDSSHMSSVRYQDNNNQQVCAYFFFAAHTCQIAISPISITRRTPQGGGVDLWVEDIYDARQLHPFKTHPLTLTSKN